MDFRELNYVTAIAKYQSITKAAQSLFITQPTLTKFLQDIDMEYGQPLFRKLGNKFFLTYAGQIYIETASQILELKKQLDNELDDIIKRDVGVLKIAFPNVRGTYILPKVLPAFREMYPNVNLTVWDQDSMTLENMMVRGEVDLSFFNLPIESKDISFESINDEEFVLILSPEHPLAGEGVAREGCKYPWIDLRRFKNDSFILQNNNQRSRANAEKLLKESGITPNVVLSLRNIMASARLVAENYGVGFITETHFKNMSFDKKPVCFSVGNPSTILTFVAAWRKCNYLPRYTQDFIKIVKKFS